MLHIEHPSLDSIVRIGAPSGKTSAMQIYSNAGTYTWQMGVPFNADKFVIDEASISSGDDLVIYTGGIVMMGRNSPAATTKDPVLEVDGYITCDGIGTRLGTGGSDNPSNIFNWYWVDDSGYELRGYIDTTEVCAFDINTDISDYRLKDNVEDIGDGILEKINELRPVTYTMKAFGACLTDDSNKRPSFIAHEVQEQFPDIVKRNKDQVNDDGEPEYQNYSDRGLTAYLVKAVQELSAKVTVLENN